MRIEEADKNMKAIILEDELFNYYNPLINDLFLIEGLPFACDVFTKDSQDIREFYYNFQKEMVEKKKANGDKNIYFLDGNTLFGKKDVDEFTVDGYHPTDLGFYKLAMHLINPLKKF